MVTRLPGERQARRSAPRTARQGVIPGPTLTEALVRLHGAGRADTYGAALLDVAQDHLLWLLVELGLLDGSSLIFKGGTSLRKCRLGSSGRFSTDLEFVASDDATVLEVCEAIDGASVSGFRFSLLSTRGDGRHWSLQVTHPQLDQPDVVASVEFARRPLVLAPEALGFVVVPVHRAYEIELPTLPVISAPEATAEKLARYRRVSLGRGVYDLAQFAGRPVDERLVRRLWVLKVWVMSSTTDAARVLSIRPMCWTPGSRETSPPESIGKLTQPVDVVAWERRVRGRFGFLADLDDIERRWVQCDPRHRAEINDAIRTGGFS